MHSMGLFCRDGRGAVLRQFTQIKQGNIQVIQECRWGEVIAKDTRVVDTVHQDDDAMDEAVK